MFYYLRNRLILACLKAHSTFLYHQTSIPVPRSQTSITGASVYCTEALKAVCLHGHLSCLWANVCPLKTLTCDQRWQWLNWGSVWHEVTHRQWPGWAPSVPQCHLWGLEAQGGEDRPRPHVSKARGCVSNPGSTDHALCIRLLFGNQRHQIRVFLLF